MNIPINNQYKQQIIKGLKGINLSSVSELGGGSVVIPFFKQADLLDCLVEVCGEAYLKKNKSDFFDLIGFESISISCWDDNGKVEIDNSSFDEIYKSLTFNNEVW